MDFILAPRENETFTEALVVDQATAFVTRIAGMEPTEVSIYTEYDRNGEKSRDAVNERNKSYRGWNDELVVSVTLRLSDVAVSVYPEVAALVKSAQEVLTVRDEDKQLAARREAEAEVSRRRAELADAEARLSQLA
jgi:hypothetical protein